jgi:hypothetical protein
MLIRNTESYQGSRQRFLVELRIGSRSRNLSDIHDTLNVRFAQQLNETFKASTRVANGEEGKLHATSSSHMVEGAAFMGCDVICLIAFDLVLWSSFEA